MYAVQRERYRGMADDKETSGDSPVTREKRHRVDEFHVAFFAGKEIAKKRAQ